MIAEYSKKTTKKEFVNTNEMNIMNKKINSCISLYKEQINESDIQKTYTFLLKYLMQVKTSFEKAFSKEYSCGYVAPGYMDYSYFSFTNDYLKNNGLRFGIVLNHNEMRFELWLLGQNKEVQNRYWDILKESKWNEGLTKKPQYAELEIVLVDTPDFENIDKLTADIINRAVKEADKVIVYLKKLD
jgi:hypothetical protein